jgi:hypothetical protein
MQPLPAKNTANSAKFAIWGLKNHRFLAVFWLFARLRPDSGQNGPPGPAAA